MAEFLDRRCLGILDFAAFRVFWKVGDLGGILGRSLGHSVRVCRLQGAGKYRVALSELTLIETHAGKGGNLGGV